MQKDKVESMLAMFEGETTVSSVKKRGRPRTGNKKQNYNFKLTSEASISLDEVKVYLGSNSRSEALEKLIMERKQEERLPRDVQELIISFRDLANQTFSPALFQAIIQEKIDNYLNKQRES